jgi:3-methyladenine DNA glycosylase AlkC
MEERQLMKDGLGPEAIRRIAAGLRHADPKFPVDKFREKALQGLDRLELKDRVRHVIGVLHGFLPAKFEDAAHVLGKLPDVWVHGAPNDPLRGFAAWPVIDYVGVYGLDDPRTALPLLKRLTPLFSAEFAIRPFLKKHQQLTLDYLEGWVYDDSMHVRRLVSEGTRPRLPWGERLPAFIEDPTPVLRLLEELKDDPEEYVRRSVANNLNDIAKDNSKTVVAICAKWMERPTDERAWIVRHACRTLVKEGDKDALRILGFHGDTQVSVDQLTVDKQAVSVGAAVTFSFQLHSNAKLEQRLVVDYAVHLVKANGQARPKVFKLKNLRLAPGETVQISKAHSFKAITTRSYYPGAHRFDLLVNGDVVGSFQVALSG